MYARTTIAILVLPVVLFAQAPAPCPSDRPVDDLIAATKKQHSKRNKNPLPGAVCILGWCKDTDKTPPTIPTPAPKVQAPSQTDISPTEPQSAKTAEEICNEDLEKALRAAHDVEVGDGEFRRENYKGALSRYQAARENKPSDIAIEVRLGRVFERLHDSSSAIQHYEAAQKLRGTGKWAKEADAAIMRLEQTHSTRPHTLR